jgi:hypothetical protein
MDVEHWEWIFWGVPISLFDVEKRRWYTPPGLSVAGGTDVSGAQGVGA